MELTDEKKKPLFFSMKLPSLKELSLTRIARAVWTSKGVISEFYRVQNAFGESARRHYKPVEKKARSQASLLPLPSHLAKEVAPLINYLGGVLYYWIALFENKSRLYETFSEWPDRVYQDYIVRDKLRWTAYGTLDHLKTAKLLLYDDSIPVKDRLEMSCNFCMEEEIRRLWNELPTTDSFNVEDLEEDALLYYWYSKLQSTCEEAPISSVIHQLYFSDFTEFQSSYFWPKMSVTEQERYLADFIEKAEYYPLRNGNFFLINKMDFEQQRKVPRSDAWGFLRKFLTRPWQHLFFSTFSLIKDHLDTNGFYDFLRIVTLNQCDDKFRDRFYTEIGPWMQSPRNPSEVTACLVYQVWAGNVDFVKEITRGEPISLHLELIVKVFDGPKNIPTHNLNEPVEVLESMKDLIKEWLSKEEWRELKSRLTTDLARNVLWDGLATQLENFVHTLDDVFGEEHSCQMAGFPPKLSCFGKAVAGKKPLGWRRFFGLVSKLRGDQAPK